MRCALVAMPWMLAAATVQVGGLRLQYVDWGGSGTALIFVPGGCDTAFVFGDVAERLARRFRVLGLTARGCGASDRPETGYGMDQQVADIVGAMDAWGIRRATLIGHSSGTGKMTQVARRHPDRVERLVYLDPVYRYVAPGLEEKLDAAITRAVGGAVMDSWERRKRTAQLWELGAWSPAMELDMREKRQAPTNWRKEVTRDMEAGLYFETRIAHPALAIFAMNTDRDRARQLDAALQRELRPLIEETERRRRAEIAAFRANGKHVHIVQLRHAAHYVFVQRPDEIARRIAAFCATPPAR